MAHLTSLKKSLSDWNDSNQNHRAEIKWLLIVTAAFCSFLLIFSLHRYYTFYASYDHGLFNQIFWNNLHRRWFQSSLTGEHAAAFVLNNEIPPVNFNHLGQHFVPNFLLWLPIYALFPSPVTLIVLQIGLMAAGGVVLYALARHYLAPTLSLLITAGYFGAHAVIGPTFANFYEHNPQLCSLELEVNWISSGRVNWISSDVGRSRKYLRFSVDLERVCGLPRCQPRSAAIRHSPRPCRRC